MSLNAFQSPWLQRRAAAVVGLLVGLLAAAFAPVARADDFLPPEQAFRISVKPADAHSVEVDFAIAPGYYMYRGRFKFGAQGATLGTPQLPLGKVKFDDALGETVETYHDAVRIRVPVTQAGGSFRLGVIGQGCSEAGLCYPPMPSVAEVHLSGFGGDGSARLIATGDAAAPQMPEPTITAAALSAGAASGPAAGASAAEAVPMAAAAKPGIAEAFSKAAPLSKPASDAAAAGMADQAAGASGPVTAQAPAVPAPDAGAAAQVGTSLSAAPVVADDAGTLAGVLQGHHFWAVIAAFLGAGLLLSLTPCVLPMLPILSSIIVGHMAGRPGAGAAPVGGAERRRGLMLAASYALGMALVYTAFGIVAGLAGRGLAAALQTPAVLGAFGLLLVLLSLSMFGLYELQLPSALTTRLTQASHRLRGGHVAGVFVMGGLSALIVSPCVAAPLAGALLYLSQTHDVLLGGTALFALACGMSVPLLLVGASAGALLPKAGTWMEGVKQFFGVLLLAVAVWMVQPVLPPALVLGAWAALLALSAALLLPPASVAQAHGHAGFGTAVRRAAGWLALLLALAEVVGAASGATDAWQPLAPLARARATASAPAAAGELSFRTVRSEQELDAVLHAAGRPVMLDFYADWCVSCKEMDRFTFNDPAIRQRLSRAVLLRADVTADTPANRALLKRFSLFGPPGTIFFDAQGRELPGVRVVGFQNVERFGGTLTAAGL